MEMSMNNLQIELLDATKRYLGLGFSIIPIGSEKKPLFTWKEFQSRKATLEEAQGWFDTLGDRITGIALVTGAISGLAVVDVEKGGPMDHLPDTVCSESGGGGFHYYYKYDLSHPIQNHTRVRTLTDIRGEGGYIILPPSLHASGGRYSWLYDFGSIPLAEFPYWLIEQAPEKPHGDGPVQKGGRNEAAARYAGKLLHDLDPSLWDSQGWQEFVSWNESNCNPPVPERELKTVWKSIKKKESPKRQRPSDLNAVEVYSKVTSDGGLYELTYDSEMEETSFWVFRAGERSKVNSFEHRGVTYVPPAPSHPVLATRSVLLPSDCVDFGTEAELLNEVRGFIHEYVQISEEFERIAAYYVLFTWAYDLFHEVPYLRAIGDFGTGKSRLLCVVGSICYKPLSLNGATSVSAIFRLINDIQGTLVLDEADFRHSDTTQEIVKILNAGFQKNVPVFRSEAIGKNNKTFQPTPFVIFGPKILATRETFADEALESRCLTYVMFPRTRDDIPENLNAEFDSKALALRNKLLAFRFHKINQGFTDAQLPKGLDIEPRLRQIIKPLYSLLEDGVVREDILQFVQIKQKGMVEKRFNSFDGEVLRALIAAWDEGREPSMQEIVEKYELLFVRGKYPLAARKVGQLVDTVFRLQKHKTSVGICLVRSSENEHQIEELKLKYGLFEPIMNDVNVVNIPWEGDLNLFDNPKES